MATNKSASKLKLSDPAKKAPYRGPSLEKMLEDARVTMRTQIKIQMKQDSRFDTLMAIREAWHRFNYDRPEEHADIEYARDMAAKVRDLHELVGKAVEAMTVEYMTADEWDNPCDELVSFDDPESWQDVLDQSILFSAIQPYGQHFDDVREQLMNAKAQGAE